MCYDISIKGQKNKQYSGIGPETLYDPDTEEMENTGRPYNSLFDETLGKIQQYIQKCWILTPQA